MKKIVLTGGPSSGKSTVIQALVDRGSRNPVPVPESARMLLFGGYPAPAHGDLEEIRAFQRALLAVQENLEFAFTRRNPDATHLVLDRARLDGAAFWPPGPEDFFRTFGIDPERALLEYDAVLFLEMPSEAQFGGMHQARFHDYRQSLESAAKLERIWSRHPRFQKIPAQSDFPKKPDLVLKAIESVMRRTY